MALSNDDLKKVKKIVSEEVTNQLDSRLGKGLEKFEELIEDIIDRNKNLVKKEDIKRLPTTDLFLSKMDELMGEVKTSREEETMLSGRVAIHSNQLDRIEKHIGISAFASEF